MTRTIAPETKTRIRQSPLPVIGAVVAIILVVFYGWSQRGWLINVTDIESRDVYMQSQQLERGFEPSSTICTPRSATMRSGTKPPSSRAATGLTTSRESLDAGALVRLDVDTILVLDRNLETRASLAIDRDGRCRNTRSRPIPNLLAAIKQGVTSGQLNGQSDSVRGIVQRARGPALFVVRPIFDSAGTGQPQGWIAFARAFSPAVVERMGRFSPWPVTGFPVAKLDRSGLPDEVRDWVRRSPLTANLLTRVAGRSHLNGYLILRDQVGTPVWLVQLEIPRSAYRAGDAHHALPDHPARPAGRRLHHRCDAAGGALAPAQRRPPVARVALPRHHRAGAGRPAGRRRAHRRNRRRQSGRAGAARLHARRTARPLRAVRAARPERFAGSGHRDAGARRAQPRHRTRAVAQGRPPDGRRSELRADRIERPAARVLSHARPVRAQEGADAAARQPAAPRQARESRSPDGPAEPPVPAGASAARRSRAARNPGRCSPCCSSISTASSTSTTRAATKSATSCCRKSPSACAPRCARPTSSCAWAATSSSWCCIA